jgi:hypothetical protein
MIDKEKLNLTLAAEPPAVRRQRGLIHGKNR